MPDSVSARILVTNNSNPEIAIAGASLGARLGFETSALTFPLTIDESNLFEKNFEMEMNETWFEMRRFFQKTSMH